MSTLTSRLLNKSIYISSDFLFNKKSEEIYDDLFNNLLINVDNIYLQNTGKWSWLLSPENKVRDFMMRQLNIQEAMNAILNFKI